MGADFSEGVCLNGKMLRVLLIESDPVEAALISGVLTKRVAVGINFNIEVSWATSMTQALDLMDPLVAAGDMFDVLLLGGDCPDANGGTVAAYRSMSQAVSVPIVLLVRERHENGLTAELYGQGIEDFLFRGEGFMQDRLLRAICTAIKAFTQDQNIEKLARALGEAKRLRAQIVEHIPELLQAIEHIKEGGAEA